MVAFEMGDKLLVKWVHLKAKEKGVVWKFRGTSIFGTRTLCKIYYKREYVQVPKSNRPGGSIGGSKRGAGDPSPQSVEIFLQYLQAVFRKIYQDNWFGLSTSA